MLRISVAMTTYNGARFLLRQLESLQAQIRLPDEVVIVDDGSTDETVAIAREFIAQNQLKSWKLFENEENLGFIRNFRKAVSLTTGDVVFLCDQDDVWCEDKLECITNFFAQYPEILAVNSSFAVMDADERESDAGGERGRNNYGFVCQKLRRPLERITLRTVLHSNISPGCTAAFRRKIVDAYVAGTDCTLPHDYEMNLLAAAKNGLYFYNMPLINYRIHGDNTLGFAAKPQTRTEIAAEKIEAAKAVRYGTQNSRLFDFCAARLRMLTEKSVGGWLRLFRYPQYLRFYSFKECLGDLLYTIKG